MLSLTAQKAIAAYGGKELWQNHKYIEAEVSAHGLAFTLKRRPVFEHAIIKMDIAKPFCKLTPIGKNKNITGVLDGNDVRLVDENGKIIEERKNARSFFPFGRRLFYWDDLDMAYFANYAFWNYFTLPNLLLSENIKWIEKTEGVLEATFPPDFPTHNKIQEFIFDKETGLLKQHNYTVDIISTLAKAANVVIEHGKTNNLVYPSKRLVTPKGKSGKALGGPILIDITVHSFKLTNE
jgi:hypothetical protein